MYVGKLQKAIDRCRSKSIAAFTIRRVGFACDGIRPEVQVLRRTQAYQLTERYGVVVKGKVFPYSLPSVGPGADPGVQAVSPQVT